MSRPSSGIREAIRLGPLPHDVVVVFGGGARDDGGRDRGAHLVVEPEVDEPRGGHSIASIQCSGFIAGTAAVRPHRALQALKKRLELSCGTCTEHGCLDCTCQATPGATGTSASL